MLIRLMTTHTQPSAVGSSHEALMDTMIHKRRGFVTGLYLKLAIFLPAGPLRSFVKHPRLSALPAFSPPTRTKSARREKNTVRPPLQLALPPTLAPPSRVCVCCNNRAGTWCLEASSQLPFPRPVPPPVHWQTALPRSLRSGLQVQGA